MEVSRDDWKIIERALKFAAANTTDHAKIGEYVEVWRKLDGIGNEAAVQQDGFRYDYDD